MPSKAAHQPVNRVTMVVMKYVEQCCSAPAVNIKEQSLLALTPSHYPEKETTLKNTVFYFNS